MLPILSLHLYLSITAAYIGLHQSYLTLALYRVYIATTRLMIWRISVRLWFQSASICLMYRVIRKPYS